MSFVGLFLGYTILQALCIIFTFPRKLYTIAFGKEKKIKSDERHNNDFDVSGPMEEMKTSIR